MKKVRSIIVVLALTILVCAQGAATAHAAVGAPPNKFAYAVTTVVNGPVAATPYQARTLGATLESKALPPIKFGGSVGSYGTAGTSSHAGSRSVYVTTTYYDLLGFRVASYTTGVWWSWHANVVTNYGWIAPHVHIYQPFIYYEGSTYGPAWWINYSSQPHGCRYMSIHGHIVEEITRWGRIAQVNPLHEYYIRGNGTYSTHNHK